MCSNYSTGLGAYLKILHLIASTGTGGAERHVLDLCRTQQQQGLSVSVALPAGRGVAPQLQIALNKNQIQHVNIRSGGRWNLLALWSLHQAIQRVKPDVIHAHMPKSIAMINRLHLGVPCVGTAHNIVKQISPFQACQQVICVSERVQHSLLMLGYPAEKTRVIHNAIDMTRFAHINREQARKNLVWEANIVVLCVARLVPAKGQCYAIEALAALSAMYPNLRLALAGTGADQNMLRALALRLGVVERVLFLGSRDDVPQLMAAADMYVQPSIKEGFGIALLEAMASGLPCIGTPTGAMPEMIAQGRSGLIIPAADAHALSQAMQSLLSQPDLCAQMSEAGRRVAQSQFSLVRQAQGTFAVYQQAVKLKTK